MSWDDNDLIQYQNNFGGNMEMTSVPQGRRRNVERTVINSNNDTAGNVDSPSVPQGRQRNVQRTYVNPQNDDISFASQVPESSRPTTHQTYISPEQNERSNYTQGSESTRQSNYTQDSEPIRQSNSTYQRTVYHQREIDPPNYYYGSMLHPGIRGIASGYAQPSHIVIRHNTGGQGTGFNFGQFIRNINPMLILLIILLIVVLAFM